MSRTMLEGLVLAAGLSRRMGVLKPLLPLDGIPALLHATATFSELGVSPIVVVGHRATEVADVLSGSNARVVTNDAFESGMWSSVQCGLRAADAQRGWVAVLPADCALVRAETAGRVLRRAWKSGKAVLYPQSGGRRGHPPLIRATLTGEMLSAAPSGGLREALADHEMEADDVPVEDAAVLLDMDTLDEYRHMDALARRERLPDAVECARLQARFAVSPPVREHCAAVAGVAERLGQALQSTGLCLNLRLLRAAALLHDIARGEADHAAAGAALLVQAGYPRVAAVTARHMELEEPPESLPGEAEVLYLSDKLVEGTRVVSLELRLAHTLERLGGDERARDAAHRRLAAARRVSASIESLTAKAVPDLLR